MATITQSGDIAAHFRRGMALRVLSLISIGILIFALFALVSALSVGRLSAIGIGGMIFLAAASVGGAFGFLFAVPRVLSQDNPDSEEKPADPNKPAERQARFKDRLLRSNTNLERISDWLTTMLVGVGLSQLGSIDSGLTRFRDFLATYAKSSNTQCSAKCIEVLPAIGPMILIFGLVMGFLGLYIYTRLVLVSLFNQIEWEIGNGGELNESLDKPDAAQAVVAAAQSLETNNENPALKGLVSSDDPSVGESLGVMFNLLYQPGKYQDVIELSAHLANTPATKRPEYWFYLAAAFGQKYSALKQNNASEEELLSTRDNALDCARRAVVIDPSYRARLWNISDPNSFDNDLADFRSDPTFLAITGVTIRQTEQ